MDSKLPRLFQFSTYRSNGKKYRVLRILVLRWVCRHCRAVAAELDFWYNGEFRFDDLICVSIPRSFDANCKDERFLRALFSDVNLGNSLDQRKKDWTFRNLEELMMVLERIPLFIQNARAITLEIRSSSTVKTAIRALAACLHIIKLSISLAKTVNLSAVAVSFASLEILNFYLVDNFRGSLGRLDHLHTLRVIGSQCGVPPNESWLPLQSVTTFTKLDVYYDTKIFFNTDSLDAFVNLNSLSIGILTETLCEVINGAQIQLDVFKIAFDTQICGYVKSELSAKSQTTRNFSFQT